LDPRPAGGGDRRCRARDGRTPDSTPDLATIDVPTLVITSDGDLLIPPDVSAPMADQIPGAQLAVLPGVGHLSNLEDPTGFSRSLAAHLERSGVEP